MARLDLGTDLEEFRAELSDWLVASAPPGLADVTDWYRDVTILAGSNRQGRLDAYQSALYREWEAILMNNAMIYPHWPESVGGRDWSTTQTAILSEECFRLGIPRVRRGFSADLVATALLTHGTADQQTYFLPRIIRGEDRYCQGYSEPNSGSDLAAVETKGVVEGNEIVITGQKVWTSEFEGCNMMFLLCATEQDKPKHKRLTFVLLPFEESNNVTIRPIRQMTGGAEFCEDFLDGARAPLFNVIGAFGNGWQVALSTLDTERTGEAVVSYLGFESQFYRLLALAKENGAAREPRLRDRLVQSYIRTQVMRYQGQDTLARISSGIAPAQHCLSAKLLWSEHHAALGNLAMDIVGPDSMVRPPWGAGPDPYDVDEWQDLFLASRGGTIYAGTNEIQRTIIADRALGLPREPRQS